MHGKAVDASDVIAIIPAMSDMEMGHRIRERRRQLGLSAKQVAECIGQSESAVRNVENGTNGASLARAQRYAEVLGVTQEWLLFGDSGGSAVGVPIAPPARNPITLTQIPNGKARLEMNVVLPFSVALQVLQLVEGGEK